MPAQTADEKPRSGEQLFKIYCAKCHTTTNAQTTGRDQNVAPGLRHILRSGRMTEAQLREIVMKGKNTMPPFERRMDGAELDRLVAYLKTK